MSSRTESDSDQIEVLLVDDHPAVREALAVRLESAMGISHVASCDSAGDAMSVLAEREPDVMVMDISLEDGYGLDLLENVCSVYPDVEVVVFSMYDEEVYAERAVRKGARSYLMKSEPTEKVIEAIRRAHEGSVFLSNRMSTNILNQLPSNGSSDPAFPIDELTDRELAVFQMLGRGYNISDITDRLNLCRKTVETYRRRAKEKLKLESTSELLQYAVKWIHSQGAEKEVEPISQK